MILVAGCLELVARGVGSEEGFCIQPLPILTERTGLNFNTVSSRQPTNVINPVREHEQTSDFMSHFSKEAD